MRPNVTLVSEATVTQLSAGASVELKGPCVVTPAARKLARQKGIDLRRTAGAPGEPFPGGDTQVLDLTAAGTHPLAACIDSTLLAAQATPAQVAALAEEASRLGFAAVCVNPLLVSAAVRRGGVGVAAVCGFPLGATASAIKAAEARLAESEGASEIDMVLPLGLLKAGQWRAVADDVAAVRGALTGSAILLKVIIEAPLLTDDEVLQAARIATEAGAHFIKTGTGFCGAALPGQVRLIRRAVGDRARIKAAGGVRDGRTALALLDAGADRLGTSHAALVLADGLRLLA